MLTRTGWLVFTGYGLSATGYGLAVRVEKCTCSDSLRIEQKSIHVFKEIKFNSVYIGDFVLDFTAYLVPTKSVTRRN